MSTLVCVGGFLATTLIIVGGLLYASGHGVPVNDPMNGALATGRRELGVLSSGIGIILLFLVAVATCFLPISQ